MLASPQSGVRVTDNDCWRLVAADVAMELSARVDDRRVLLNPALGPEPITGSTRMKGGTATKVLLVRSCQPCLLQSGMSCVCVSPVCRSLRCLWVSITRRQASTQRLTLQAPSLRWHRSLSPRSAACTSLAVPRQRSCKLLAARCVRAGAYACTALSACPKRAHCAFLGPCFVHSRHGQRMD